MRRQFGGAGGNCQRKHDDDGGVADREPETNADRAFALLHQLAGDVVDGGNVVRIYGVAQAETVG